MLLFVQSRVFRVATRRKSEKIRVPEQGAEHMTFQLFSTNHWAAGGPRMSEAF